MAHGRLWRYAKDLLWLTQQTVRLVAERDKLAGIAGPTPLAIEPLRHRALEKPKPRIEKRMKKPRKKSQTPPGRCQFCKCTYEEPAILPAIGQLGADRCGAEDCVAKAKAAGVALFGASHYAQR